MMDMKRRQRRGFSLAEVIIGFVLLSFIIVMVSSVITSAFTMSSKLSELPNAYYGAQDKAERGLDVLSAYVKDYYRLQNEINNTAMERLDPEVANAMYDERDAAAAKLDDYEKESFTLFGKSIDVYKFEVEHVSATNQHSKLHLGVVNAETLDRLVPIIDEVTISASGSTDELYFGDGTTVKVTAVDYNTKNRDLRNREIYQWYRSVGGFHTALYRDGAHFNEEPQYNNTIYSAYPNNFEFLGKSGDSITIDESFYGQMLVCLVSPLSNNGAYGESVVSNYLYVSALPKLSSGTYNMLIDASMTQYTYDSSGTVDLSSIKSRAPGTTCALVASGSPKPYVDLNGMPTDTDISISATGEGTFSRFISFADDTAMKTDSAFRSSGATTVLAVARIRPDGVSADPEMPIAPEEKDFISASGTSAGFVTNIAETDGSGDTGWRIMMANLPSSCSSFEIGHCDVDVAELIVVSGATNDELNEIWGYLSLKYRIDVTLADPDEG